MKVVGKINTNKILDIFNKTYPDLKPSKIFKLSDGYLIIAPRVKGGVDYGDPNYFVNSSITKASAFDMRRRQDMFKAFRSKPIWESD